MRKIFISVVMSIVLVALMSVGAFAQTTFSAQGGTIVPNLVYVWQSSQGYTYPWIVLTNITNLAVECRVRFYDSEGQDLTTMGRVAKGSSSGVWETIVSGSGDFTIPAHCTRMFLLINLNNQRNAVIGYATVEWSSSDLKLRKALVGGVQQRTFYASSGRGMTAFSINNGQPF